MAKKTVVVAVPTIQDDSKDFKLVRVKVTATYVVVDKAKGKKAK